MSSLDELLERGYSESRIRVRYAETDQMGVVYHANYLVWFEVGRVDFLRDMGLDYKTTEKEDNVMFAVIEASARYKAPAHYDDEILVRTSFAGVRGTIVRFHYTVLRAATADSPEKVLCEGDTTHIVVNREMKRAPMPQHYNDRFRALFPRLTKADAKAE